MDPQQSNNDQLRAIFDRLDRNKDGKIDFDELRDSFNDLRNDVSVNEKVKFDMNQNKKNEEARRLFDLMRSGEQFDFRDFVDYVSRTDKKIELLFKDLDCDKNGLIDKSEIKRAFENLGVILSDKQIDKLMQHMDKNKSLQIDWKEWRDYFRFAPHDRMEEALRLWRTESFVDYADQSIPNDYTIKEKQSGLWWRNLVAGGVAGSISRTCTAPLDRIRIFLQASCFSILNLSFFITFTLIYCGSINLKGSWNRIQSRNRQISPAYGQRRRHGFSLARQSNKCSQDNARKCHKILCLRANKGVDGPRGLNAIAGIA